MAPKRAAGAPGLLCIPQHPNNAPALVDAGAKVPAAAAAPPAAAADLSDAGAISV